MVYTAESLALAALERFMALDSAEHAMKLVSVSATIPRGIDVQILEYLPEGWDHYPASFSTQQYGSNWIKSLAYVVLKVPSVIIPSEYKYLLNPFHPDFKKIKIHETNLFSFDSRMWKN